MDTKIKSISAFPTYLCSKSQPSEIEIDPNHFCFPISEYD